MGGTEPVERLGGECVDGGGVGNVGPHRENFGAGVTELLGRTLERRFLDVAQNQPHPLSGEALGHREPDAAGTAGDHRRLAS